MTSYSEAYDCRKSPHCFVKQKKILKTDFYTIKKKQNQ